METQRTNIVKELIENEKLFNRQMTLISEIMTKNKVPAPVSFYFFDFTLHLPLFYLLLIPTFMITISWK